MAVVQQDERAPFVAGLRRAREDAYPPGEYVGQESFMRAGEIRQLARRAGVGAGVSVLDVCCGIAGPGRFIAAETSCGYLGVDSSASAVKIAQDLARDLPCRFDTAHVPPLPQGPFEVVLLLETMLAFRDKATLVADVARVLKPGGRFAFTVEAGRPLTDTDRARMPDADTVWLVDFPELETILRDAGFEVTWRADWTAAHRATAAALLGAFRLHSAEMAHHIGSPAVRDLIAAHELWVDWLGTGRVRKSAVVAQRR